MEWRVIKDFENYQVSSTGLIKSIGRRIEKGMFGGKISSYYRHEKILKSGVLRGYHHVSLRKDNKTKIFKVHRLVLQTFEPNEDYEKLQVNHIDGDKSNNNLTNLEWCNSQENQLHRYNILYKENKNSNYNYINKISNNKWRLRGFKSKHIGYFKTEEEAKNKYDELIITNPEFFKMNVKN